MPDRYVKTTLVIDEHGAVRALRATGDQSGHTERKLGDLDRSVKGIGKSFGGLKGMLAGGLGALGAGGLVFGLSSIASKTKEVAEETEKFHAITGIGTQSSLYYTQALKARGLSGEVVTKAFGFLAKNTKTAELQEGKFAAMQGKAAAKGKVATASLGRQAEAFKELGISLSTFNGLSEQGKLETVTKAFEAMAPGARKARLERELFGRGGNALAPVLEHDNLALSKQVELAKRFFPTIKGGANAMKELLEKQAESKMAWEGLELTLGQKLIPAMTTVMGVMSKVAIEVEKGKGVWGELEHTLEGIGKFAGSAFGFIKKIGDTLGVKLGGDTLGGVLAAAAAVKGIKTVSKPISATGKVVKGIGKIGKYIPPPLYPYLAPAAAAAIYGAEVYSQRKTLGAHAQGALAMLGGGPGSLVEIERSFLGGGLTGGGYGRTRLGGRAAAGRVSPDEASTVSRLLAHPNELKSARLTPQEAEMIGQAFARAHKALPVDLKITGDGPLTQAIADAMIHNPRARRSISEAAVIHAQGMTARK